MFLREHFGAWVEMIGIRLFVCLIEDVLAVGDAKDDSKKKKKKKKNEKTTKTTKSFLVDILQCMFGCVIQNGSLALPCLSSSSSSTCSFAFVNACRQNKELVLLWSMLELEINSNFLNQIMQHIILSQKLLYSFDEKKMLLLYEEKNYVAGILILLKKASRVYQTMSIDHHIVGRSDSHPRNVHMLHIASAAIRAIEKQVQAVHPTSVAPKAATSTNGSKTLVVLVQQMSQIFEAVSCVVDVSTTVTLFAELKFETKGTILIPSSSKKLSTTLPSMSTTESIVDIEKMFKLAVLRGVLHGGGSSYALQVLECLDISFWVRSKI